MSLILPKRRLLFLHIPKCAGQSVQKAFGVVHHHQHHKLNDFPEDWQDYFRFTFVRHPVHRFFSACNYNLRVALKTQQQLQHVPIEQLSATKRYRLYLAEERPSLAAIAGDLHRNRLRKLITFKRQARWLRRGEPQFIGRVERFDQDFSLLMRLIAPGRQLRRTQAPHINRSASTLRLDDLSTRELGWIVDYYAKDFAMTGYSEAFQELEALH